MFRNIDWNRLRNIVENPLIVDGRNIFGRDEVACQGFHYVSIGRTAARPQERKHSSLEEVELGGESSPKIETRPA
jgi:hypothetical protein